MKLVIANRNYSSWSLRAWLYLRESNLVFDEVRIPLFVDDYKAQIARYSPAGRVPVLLDEDIAVWDSMAIFEHVRESHPHALGWPDDRHARARARSISAEMHSGFMALRDELPQNLRARFPRDMGRLSTGCREQIARIDTIWSECRDRYAASGPWLFGAMSIADVMFAPVALRFVTYDVPRSPSAESFVSAVQGLTSVQEWVAAAEQESEHIDFVDQRIPADQTPLTLG